MPRIKQEHRQKPQRYLAMSDESARIGEQADCGPKAVALLCDKPYAEVLSWMNANGRKPRQGTPWGVIFAAIKQFGKQYREVPMDSFIAQYPSPHNRLNTVTSHHPDRFNKVWKDGKAYLFNSVRHVSAVIDGVNYDWSKGRALRMRNVYEVY